MTAIANRQNVKKKERKKKHVFLGSHCLQFLIICERRLFGFFFPKTINQAVITFGFILPAE